MVYSVERDATDSSTERCVGGGAAVERVVKWCASFRGSTERRSLKIGHLKSDLWVYGAQLFIVNLVSLER